MHDNSAALAEFSRQRHAAATARTITALQQLESQGGAITYAGVAAAAQVSHAWLYTQPTLRAAIDELRSQTRPTGHDVPAQ